MSARFDSIDHGRGKLYRCDFYIFEHLFCGFFDHSLRFGNRFSDHGLVCLTDSLKLLNVAQRRLTAQTASPAHYFQAR